MIFLACPLCGIGSGTVLFVLLAALFFAMFAATLLVFWGSWKDGDWSKHRARWSALQAEYPEAFESAPTDETKEERS